MTNRAHTLKEIQAWMQDMLVQAGAVDTAAETPLHIAPSATLAPRARLAIYQRAYYARLIQCMEGQYKALCHALGKDLFDDFAREYLRTFPSENPTLAVLGERFPDYLENTRPDAQEAEKEPWVDFMIDLARFEWQLYHCFDAPGHEGKPYASDLAVDADLRLQPCCFFGEYRFPVSRYYHRVALGEDPDIPDAERHYTVILRKDYRTSIFALTAPQYGCLKQMQQGHSIEKALLHTAKALHLSVTALQETWPTWRPGWIESGFFIENKG